MKQFCLLEIYAGVDLTLHGPFDDEAAFAAKAQSIRDDQDSACDSLFALEIEGGAAQAPVTLTQIPAPGIDRDAQAG